MGWLGCGVAAVLSFGVPTLAQAQYLVIGDDNKLHWDDAGKPVFTEPGKDEVVIVDIKKPRRAEDRRVLALDQHDRGAADQSRRHA